MLKELSHGQAPPTSIHERRDDAFRTLISPIEKSDFFLSYWGKNYLIADGEPNRFASLFSWDALSEILSTQRFDFPRIRLLSGGRVSPPAQYVLNKFDRRGNPYRTHDAQAVERMLRAGAALHITSIAETWKPLATFAAELEPVLGGKVQVNVHAGYARSRGFHTHWDGHDVYAAQVHGSKKWRLFGFTEEAPLAVPPDEKHGAPSQHCWEGVLSTGQVLYLPRGYWHATQFTDEPSLHLTFAVQHPTGVEFLHWLTRRLSEEPSVRRDIPIPIFEMTSLDGSAKETYTSQLRDQVLRTVTPDIMDQFVNDYRAGLGNANQIQLDPTARNTNAER